MKNKIRLNHGHKGKLGDKSYNWKGNSIGYVGIHIRLARKIKPTRCINCKRERKLQWAHLGNSYSTDLSEYVTLCVSCHRLYDHQYMTIREFISDMLAQGMSEEEMLKALEKGDAKKGITPKKPPFHKLVLKKTLAGIKGQKKTKK